ncbi:MAG: hypothetical protein AAF399_03395 [Bacteroidota bacterium]
MAFSPDPALSTKVNVSAFEKRVRNNRPFHKIFIGIFYPFRPIAWLLDRGKLKEELLAGRKQIKQQLSNPSYLIKWELDQIEDIRREIIDELVDTTKIEQKLRTTVAKHTNESPDSPLPKVIQDQQAAVEKKLQLVRKKRSFCDQYLSALRLAKTYFATEEQLNRLESHNNQMLEVVMAEQTVSDFPQGQYQAVNLMSQRIQEADQVETVEELIQTLKEHQAQSS